MWKVTAKSDTEAEILFYDYISDFDDDEWGVMSAKGLINKIKALGNIKNITLRINSVGGDVFQAQAMYNYLKSHPANITVRIDGLAASAASVVAMAGNKIIMPSNALLMIHNPAGGVYGEAEDMRETAEILDKIRDTIANVYIAKTGLEREKVIAMMDSETWLDATEAHELKFCDEVEESVTVTAMAVKGGTIFRSGFGFTRADEYLTAKMPANTVKLTPPEQGTKEEKSEMEIKNASELERAYPELVGEIRNSAILAERERLKSLDSLNAPGREAIIAKAKYEDPKDARDIAMELLKTDTAQTQLQALHQDAQAVNAALPPEKTVPATKADEQAAIDAVANELNKMRGYR
ncbi:MAG: Clp protease ClpP [Synergistaceae bacterium]|nr:Clp protease ClpP [Synergistaceae bacterium]